MTGELLWNVTRTVAVIVWTLLFLACLIVMARNDLMMRQMRRRAETMRCKARKRATDETRDAWNGLYQQSCHDYERKLDEKDAHIEDLEAELKKLKKELAFWESIASRLKLSSVREQA